MIKKMIHEIGEFCLGWKKVAHVKFEIKGNHV